MSSKNELVEYFKKNICPFCIGNCNKGITFTLDGVKCVDYEKKNIEKKKVNYTYVTADRSKPIMKGLV